MWRAIYEEIRRKKIFNKIESGRDDLRCGERYMKRSEENLQQIESGRETFDEKDEAIEVVNVL